MLYATQNDVRFLVGPADSLFLRQVDLFFQPGTVFPPGAKLACVQIGIIPGAPEPERAELELSMTLSIAFGEPDTLPIAAIGTFPTMIEDVTKMVRIFDPAFAVPPWEDPIA